MSLHPNRLPPEYPVERNFPFPAYPNGWFSVAYSDEIEIGKLVRVHYFGRDLVVWRGEDGEAHVFDAHCPHLGAHFGYRGSVEGNALRCPFHHWLFDGRGRCIEIPYAKRIPPRGHARSWATCEANGHVFAWHHAEGDSAGPAIPDIDEYGTPRWDDYVRRRWQVRSRMYDMGENPVDAQHFRYLHGGVAPTFDQVPDGRGGRRNVSNLDMPTPKGNIEGSITSESYGPGFGVVHVRGVLHTIIVMANAPIDDEHVDVRFGYLLEKSDDPKQQRLGQKMVAELVRQMDQDVVIFEHKKYLTNPCLVPEDGPIAEYRKKARKDYTGEFFDAD